MVVAQGSTPYTYAEEFQRKPLLFARLVWPHVTFYREQRMIIESARDVPETFVPAGNMLGKDFVSGFIVLWAFLVHPVVRIITTSVKDDHLVVLWGEIGRFIQDAKYPLTKEKGGPLIEKHRELRKYKNVAAKEECKISYLKGIVSEKGEGMAGHHAPYTMLLIDEASGVDDVVYTQGGTWANRIIAIGNPNQCNNFFYKAVKGGDILK